MAGFVGELAFSERLCALELEAVCARDNTLLAAYGGQTAFEIGHGSWTLPGEDIICSLTTHGADVYAGTLEGAVWRMTPDAALLVRSALGSYPATALAVLKPEGAAVVAVLRNDRLALLNDEAWKAPIAVEGRYASLERVDDQRLAIGGLDGSVALVDHAGQLLASLPSRHEVAVTRLAACRALNKLVSLSYDGHVCVWDLGRPAAAPVTICPASHQEQDAVRYLVMREADAASSGAAVDVACSDRGLVAVADKAAVRLYDLAGERPESWLARGDGEAAAILHVGWIGDRLHIVTQESREIWR